MLRRLAIVVVVVVPVALAACGHGGAAPGTGISGVVLIGPQCPVQSLTSPCPDLPFRGGVRATAMDGSATTTSTDDRGRFTMNLAVGTYVVVAVTESGGGLPRPVPQTVDVRDGAYTQVQLEVDTGIR